MNLDMMARDMGLVRTPGEDDAALRRKLVTSFKYKPRPPLPYLRLCLLLYRLGVKSARRDLPIGVI